jgi:hypothetical protein
LTSYGKTMNQSLLKKSYSSPKIKSSRLNLLLNINMK